MPIIFLTPHDLATRWCLEQTTLTQWRWNGRGPQYFRIGRHVIYKLQDIEIYEEKQRYQNTTEYTSQKPADLNHENKKHPILLIEKGHNECHHNS